jgi:hypothetical protein
MKYFGFHCHISLNMAGFCRDLFVVDVPKHLICMICLDVLNDPHQCKNHVEHLFCNFCIKKSVRNYNCKKQCPACREKLCLKDLKQVDATRLEIGTLQAKCNKTILEDSVCQWIGFSADWEDHDCEHVLIGRSVTKVFPGHGSYDGTIVSLDK